MDWRNRDLRRRTGPADPEGARHNRLAAEALYERDQFSRAVLRFYDINPDGWIEDDLFEVAGRLAAGDFSADTMALVERGQERSWKGRHWARTGVWPA